MITAAFDSDFLPDSLTRYSAFMTA